MRVRTYEKRVTGMCSLKYVFRRSVGEYIETVLTGKVTGFKLENIVTYLYLL